MIVSPEGLVVDPSSEIAPRYRTSCSASQAPARARAPQAARDPVVRGRRDLRVADIPSERGRKRDFDVLTLLAEAHPDFPDAKAAALVSKP